MRNYKNERKWQKEHYDFIRVSIPKNIGLAFRDKLKNEGLSISDFLRKEIEKYIRGE